MLVERVTPHCHGLEDHCGPSDLPNQSVQGARLPCRVGWVSLTAHFSMGVQQLGRVGNPSPKILGMQHPN